ncbi:MAG: ABC transporter permease subunit [Actinobacteria bacterium]|nr:ABC transporter permease subunit [Actinomycetota bacterium]
MALATWHSSDPLQESGDLQEEALAQPAPPRRARSAHRFAKATLGPLAILAVIVGIWELVSYVVLDPQRRFLLPPLQTIFHQAFFIHSNLSVLLSALGVTTEVAMAGLGLSIIIGMLIAIAMSEFKSMERGLYPYLVVLQTIPILALVPLVGFWLGFGFTARIVVCVLISLFPIIASTLFGLQSATRAYHELFDLHHASRFTKLVKLKLPMALPSTFNGFRISAGLSVIGEIVGGYFFQQGKPDIGVLLDQFTAQLNGTMLFGAIFIASLLGVAVFWTFGGISSLVVGNWKE